VYDSGYILGPVIEIVKKDGAPVAVPLLKYKPFWRLLGLTTLHDPKQKTENFGKTDIFTLVPNSTVYYSKA